MQFTFSNPSSINRPFSFLITILSASFLHFGCATTDKTGLNPEDRSRIHAAQNLPIMSVLKKYKTYDFYVGHAIPEKKAAVARIACSVSPEDQILGYIHIGGTFNISGDKAVLITETGIYMNNPWLANLPGRFYMPYETFLNQRIHVDQAEFEIHIGSLSFIYYGGDYPRSLIAEMLKDLQKSLTAKKNSAFRSDPHGNSLHYVSTQGVMNQDGMTGGSKNSGARPTRSILLPRRTWNTVNVAVADITAYTLSPGEIMTLTETLHSTLVSTDYFSVLSRSDMNEVLDAQAFQSGLSCDDTSCLMEMGQILSVEKIIGATLGRVGSTYSFSLRLVDVETGKTELSVDEQWQGEADALLSLVEDAVKMLLIEYARIGNME